jgi:trimethylamine corrinoid protein
MPENKPTGRQWKGKDMLHQEILDKLKNATIDGDSLFAVEVAKQALEADVDPLTAVEQGLSPGMTIVGDRFETGEVYLPELMMAARVFNAAMEVLQPALDARKDKTAKVAKVVLGSVKGDVHNIGKDIVATVLGIHGFDVVDLGVDVSSLTFVEEAEKHNADIIGLSAIMTTTMPYQKEVVDVLKEKNLRDKYIVIIGGGSVSQKWVTESGADAQGLSGVDAVTKLKGLLAGKRN